MQKLGHKGLREIHERWPHLASTLEYFERLYTVPVLDEDTTR